MPIAIGALWLVFRGVRFAELVDVVRDIHLGPLFVSLVLMLGLVLLRMVRWGLFVQSVADVKAGPIFRVGSVGFMAIDLLPVRLGEFVRPILLQRWAGVPFGAGVATIVLERILDLLAVLAFLLFAVHQADLPALTVPFFDEPVELGVEGRNAVLFATTIVTVPVALLVLAGERGITFAERVLRLAPTAVAELGLSLIRSFVVGFRSFGRPLDLLTAIGLTFVCWVLNLLVLWTLLFAFGIDHLSLADAAVVMLAVSVCLMLPAPAGGLGVFEAGAVAGLLLYKVTGAQAAAFAVALHGTHIAVIAVFGVLVLATEGMGLRGLWQVGTQGLPVAPPDGDESTHLQDDGVAAVDHEQAVAGEVVGNGEG